MRTLVALILLFSLFTVRSQTLIVEWNFPDASADLVADGGIPENLSREISTEGGTSAIDFKTGYTGKAAQASGWDNGNGIKCWVVEFTTQGYDQLTISSKQISGGTNPGPRDFTIQFRVGIEGSWADVPGSAIITANDWTTGVVENLALPAECADEDLIFLRWVMTSDTNSAGGILEPTGISKIDDIVVLGQPASGLDERNIQCFSFWPNPATNRISVVCEDPGTEIAISDMSGKMILREASITEKTVIDISFLTRGIYFVRITDSKGITYTRKLLVN